MQYHRGDASWSTTHLDAGEKVIPENSRGPKFAQWVQRAQDIAGYIAGEIVRIKGLFPYQVKGASAFVTRESVLLADEMGLGKTVQVAAAIQFMRKHPAITLTAGYGLQCQHCAADATLVVCPASAKANWRNELIKWGAYEEQEILVLSGELKPLGKQVKAIIVNYDLLDKYRSLATVTWDIIVLDEAHYLKNPKAKRTLLVFGGKRKTAGVIETYSPFSAKKKIALTGTPIVNRPEELYPMLHWLDPVGWAKAWDFYTKFCGAKRGRFGWDKSGATNQKLLQTRLRRTIMVRRTKADVLDLPPKWRQVIKVDPDTNTRKVLKAEKSLLKRLTGTDKLTDKEFKRLMTGFKKHKIAFEEMSAIRAQLAEAKADLVIEHLTEAVNSIGKVGVFIHHQILANQISKAFGKKCVLLTGKTPTKKRQELVERFQGDDSCQLFIGNIQAAGIAITLTACNHVVFAELSWVPGEMAQAEDRYHRIGQGETVTIQYLVVDGSIDARMAELIIEKQEVIKEVLDG